MKAKQKFLICVLVLVVLAIVAFGYYFNGSFTNHVPATVSLRYERVNSGVTVFDTSPLMATGISMEPTMSTGNTLLLRPYDGVGLLKEGTIVIAIHDDNTIAHRVVASYWPDFVYMKGDNNKRVDKIPIENVTHIVVGVLYT